MLTKAKIAGIVAVSSALAVFCGEGDEAGYKFQYYSDDNDVQVYSNIVSASKKLSDKWSLSASYLVDAISGASRRDVHGQKPDTSRRQDAVTGATRYPVDAISGATPTDEKRHQISGTLTFMHDFIKMFSADKNNDDPATLSITGINSQENDYTSRTVSLSASQDLFQRNTTLGLRAGKSFDRYSPAQRFLASAQADPGWNYFGNGQRQTDNLSVSFTQGLSVTTVVSLIGGYYYDRGYLSRPYYVYKINDVYRHELYPSQKTSMTAAAMLNQYVTSGSGLSFHLEYRYYTDSWEIASHTAEAEMNFRVGDFVIIRPSYRFYTQTGAFFYKDVYDSSDYYLTTDLKYRGGWTHTLGLKLSWELRDFVKPVNGAFFSVFPAGIDIGAEYYVRSGPSNIAVLRSHYSYFNDYFDALWIQTGVRFAF
jgi:hypothetical protein